MGRDVKSEYRIKKIENGLGGFILEEVEVEPYVRDLSIYERATEYEKEFDITNWKFFMAFDGEKTVGAITMVAKTEDVNMLSGRNDACVLWDIRVEDKAELKNGDNYKEILMFGPLCVAPEWQGCGIGGILLDETLKLAKVNGYEGVIIFGEPDYYPLHGFKTCDNYGITTIDGSNFDAFLGIELVEGGLKDFGGVFIEPKVFEDLPEEENEEFTKTFDAPQKQKFPCQWD